MSRVLPPWLFTGSLDWTDMYRILAHVAQWIMHRLPEPGIAGSNPVVSA